jgi:starch-binding outer membrane protein, SusD/RagB family
MMKVQLLKNKILVGLSVILLIAPMSCKDALDLQPLSSISDATYWKQPLEFKLAANKFYNYLRAFDNNNSAGGSRGTTDLAPDKSAYARGTNTTLVTDDNYSNAYRWIRDTNYLLAKAKDYTNPDQIKNYVAEAKFFRAYIYFDKLLTSYGGVILVKEPLTTQSTDEELQGTRATRDETIDFIIQDLEEAIVDLPLESGIQAADKGRVSKQAAQAFLGRVALYEGTWLKYRNGNASRYNALLDKAISNTDAVITSNEFELFKPAALGDSALKYLFILENQKSNPANITKAANKEYILAVRYESNNLVKTIPGQISFGALGSDASRKLADMFLASDGLPIDKTAEPFTREKMNSEFQQRDNRMRYFMTVPGFRYWQNAVNYHINWDWSAADLKNAIGPYDTWANGVSGYEKQQWAAERQVPNSQEGYDYPVIRLAEVYLNYAEAVFERNGTISDGDLDKSLNLVRNRVNKNMPALSNGFVAANGLDMREEIRRERTIELQGEGFRFDDLKRWYIAHIELNKAILGVRWTGTEYVTKYPKKNPAVTADGDVLVEAESERKFSEKNYLNPIPTKEIQLNPNLEQNPGW